MYVSNPTRLPQPPRRLELIKVTSHLRPSFTGTERPGVRGRQARTFPRQLVAVLFKGCYQEGGSYV